MNGARHLSTAAIWGWPLLLGVLTSIGLVSALFSDGGLGDMLAGICLAAPVAVGLWFGWLRRRPQPGDDSEVVDQDDKVS